MPISIEEFQQGNIIDGSSKIVLDFLRSSQDQAFTEDEIIEAVNPNPTPESFIHFLAAMAPLWLQGLVERREISIAGNCITGQHSHYENQIIHQNDTNDRID